MRDGQHEPGVQAGGKNVSRAASNVLVRLADRGGRAERVLNRAVLEKLNVAVQSPVDGALEALLPELRRSRVSGTDLCDIYFPQIARDLGVAWEMDQISFASLSIAVARMQAFLRVSGSEWAGDAGKETRVGTLLLIIPEGEQHTLGAITLLGQLRRHGVSVCLRIAPDHAELRLLLSQRLFNGAMVSIGSLDRLAAGCDLVRILKQEPRRALRVVVGGAVLFNDVDVLAATGADCVTNDLRVALTALGLGSAQVELELRNG